MESKPSKLLRDLNEQQRHAVTRIDGPMLILAGAGSGKTRAITYKIAHLIEQRYSRPECILAVTFTNKAATEMRERVEQLLGNLPAAPLISTFHSFAVRMLRRHADRVGYSNDFAICDSDDQRAIYVRICKQLELESDDMLSPSQLRGRISWAKNQGWGPDEYAQNSHDYHAPVVHRVFEAYEKYLKRSNAMDFDDLILHTVRLLTVNAEVRERTGQWYRHILVDEYQDTNAPQYDLIRRLTSSHQNLTVVGDEDQSIYRFRGADINNILRFEKDYPGAEVVKLEQNYRSTQTILDAATAVVSNNVQRKGKTLWTDLGAGDPIQLYVASDAHEEALYAAQRIFAHLQQKDGAVAVLYRTNFQSRQFEEALRRLNIPYRLVGGASFYNRREVKDALAYLRSIRNPRDTVSLQRIINQPTRGIGAVTLDRLQRFAAEQNFSLWEGLETALRERHFAARTHNALKRFVKLIEESQALLAKPLHLALEGILERSGYRESLERLANEESESRLMNLEELMTVAREYGNRGQDLQEFLDHAALYSDTDEYDPDAVVHLMTLHNAKGLEFPIVFLVGCEEGLFPHIRSFNEEDIEEERRLCYVGMTRARKQLYLSYCRYRRSYGQDNDTQRQPSRFLSEVPDRLLRVRSPFASRSAPVPRRRRSNYNGKTYNDAASVQQFLDKLPLGGNSGRKISTGAWIEHAKYGRGRVLHVEDTGDDLKVSVRFPGLGIKKMLQKYAKLKVV